MAENFIPIKYFLIIMSFSVFNRWDIKTSRKSNEGFKVHPKCRGTLIVVGDQEQGLFLSLDIYMLGKYFTANICRGHRFAIFINLFFKFLYLISPAIKLNTVKKFLCYCCI